VFKTKSPSFVLLLFISSIIGIIGICTCLEFGFGNVTSPADLGKDWKINKEGEPFQPLRLIESSSGVYDCTSLKLYPAPILSSKNPRATNLEFADGKGRIDISILRFPKEALRIPKEAVEDNILEEAAATQLEGFSDKGWSQENITFNGRPAHLAEGTDWKGNSKGILAVELNTSVVVFDVTTDRDSISTWDILKQIRFNST
jgi:hypothetical protein